MPSGVRTSACMSPNGTSMFIFLIAMPGAGRLPLVKEERCAAIAFGWDCDVEVGLIRS